ncbi:ubiquitin-hydrolase Zn-finger-containing protein [Mucilaginibacter yixingensis]|uniref:Ubiquitin-hydrolase Zn-finger-containing protein n=1 Tax=Mucilaginibacter yixingensis TaxID=1295612 RepID=A0A2T5JBG0_9SPHI|nr:UBP-type zinc finger domain-containing protein [Mucilaginibacter yixingensis]PTQ98208.1 ubiquitin-hydrolase Zn-finger-containing protein [Mucilaginibacter yixingensis]
METKICEHLNNIEEVKIGDDYVCEECVKHGGHWLHLRTCQTCGITLCCDSSPMKHMTAHFHETGHPVIASAEPGERWLWCNADGIMVEY